MTFDPAAIEGLAAKAAEQEEAAPRAQEEEEQAAREREELEKLRQQEEEAERLALEEERAREERARIEQERRLEKERTRQEREEQRRLEEQARREEAERQALKRTEELRAFCKQHGFADINAPRRSGCSLWSATTTYPLHVAAELGRSDVVKMLLEEGVSPALKDSSGKMAAQLAQKKDRKGSHAAVLRELGGKATPGAGGA